MGPLYYLVWLLCGTIYPAYQSFKAIKSKNGKNYVRWMMYWVVYAVFVATESIIDPFIKFWLPFYYECKMLVLLYLVSSSTRGSSLIYKSWIHPGLSHNEAEIDLAIQNIKMRSMETGKRWVVAGLTRVGMFVSKTALSRGGGLVQQLQRSYSMVDLTEIENKKMRRRSDIQDIAEEDEGSLHLRARMKHYKSEECLANNIHGDSSLRRWRSPEMMVSSTSISSGYSTDSLVPAMDIPEDQFADHLSSLENARLARAMESLEWEQKLDQMMKTMKKSKRRLEGDYKDGF